MCQYASFIPHRLWETTLLHTEDRLMQCAIFSKMERTRHQKTSLYRNYEGSPTLKVSIVDTHGTTTFTDRADTLPSQLTKGQALALIYNW